MYNTKYYENIWKMFVNMMSFGWFNLSIFIGMKSVVFGGSGAGYKNNYGNRFFSFIIIFYVLK